MASSPVSPLNDPPDQYLQRQKQPLQPYRRVSAYPNRTESRLDELDADVTNIIEARPTYFEHFVFWCVILSGCATLGLSTIQILGFSRPTGVSFKLLGTSQCFLTGSLLVLRLQSYFVGGYVKTTPRNGGEKSYLQYGRSRLAFVGTCVSGAAFWIILGNLSGNAITFARYALWASGHTNSDKRLVFFIATAAITLTAAFHLISQRGGIVANKFSAVLKFLLVIILGLMMYQIVDVEDTWPGLVGQQPKPPSFSINTVENFSSHTSTLVSVVYAYQNIKRNPISPLYTNGFGTLSRRTISRGGWPILAFVITCSILATFFGTYLTQLQALLGSKVFDSLFNPAFELHTGNHPWEPFAAVSALGNMIISWLSATRLEQERAKEGILRSHPFYAGTTYNPFTVVFARLKSRLGKSMKSTRTHRSNFIRRNGLIITISTLSAITVIGLGITISSRRLVMQNEPYRRANLAAQYRRQFAEPGLSIGSAQEEPYGRTDLASQYRKKIHKMTLSFFEFEGPQTWPSYISNTLRNIYSRKLIGILLLILIPLWLCLDYVFLVRAQQRARRKSLEVYRQPNMSIENRGRRVQYNEVTRLDWKRRDATDEAAGSRTTPNMRVYQRVNTTRPPSSPFKERDQTILVLLCHKSPTISHLDSAMNYIQAWMTAPILWWPLPAPRKRLARGSVRMDWNCSTCSSHISADVSAAAAEALRNPDRLRETNFALNLPTKSVDSLSEGGNEEMDPWVFPPDAPVESEQHQTESGHWQRTLSTWCEMTGYEAPKYQEVRGDRAACSSIVMVKDKIYAARLWYDGEYMLNAREDAALVAVKELDPANAALKQWSGKGETEHSSSGGPADPASTSTSLSSDSSSISIPTKSYASQRKPRTYPPSQVDKLKNTGSRQVDVHMDKWIHWCVDASKTRLHEICVEAKTGAKRGVDFIQELVSSYRRIRGIRVWFSLMDCAAVKVVKFICLLDGQDWVRCNSDGVKLEEILQNREYEISTTAAPDEELHIAWVESTLAHYITHHRQEAGDRDINIIIQGLPKKMKASVGRKALSVGYGIRSVQAWSFARFFCSLGICTSFGLSFFVYWLVKHPGDIQNASVPYFMIMAAAGAFVALPDLYIQ